MIHYKKNRIKKIINEISIIKIRQNHCNFYLKLERYQMQRKSAIQSQNSVAEMHFAVTPYQIQYSTPNQDIYSIYFQKGLQILGTTQYPIQNHQKLKKLQLNIQNNIIPFRLFSQRNSQYQWSIYKRVNQMQQFLQTKKINLKDILKKQPEKKQIVQTPSSKLDRRQSAKSDIKKSQIRTSQVRNTSIRGSDLRSTQMKTTQLKGSDPNAGQRAGDGSQSNKGLVYNQCVTSQLGHFIFKFYLFKAPSSQQLNRAIEQKAKQKQQARIPLSQINLNSLPKISQTQPQCEVDRLSKQVNQSTPTPQQGQVKQAVKQIPVQSQNINTKQQQIPQAIQQTIKNQEPLAEQKLVKKVQSIKQKQTEKKDTVEKNEAFSNNIVKGNQQTPEAFSSQYPLLETNQQTPVEQTPKETPQGEFKIRRTNSNMIQAPPAQQQKVLVEATVKQPQDEGKRSDMKKSIIVILLIIIGMYLASYFKLFEREVQPANDNKGKSKFGNRKKFNKN